MKEHKNLKLNVNLNEISSTDGIVGYPRCSQEGFLNNQSINQSRLFHHKDIGIK